MTKRINVEPKKTFSNVLPEQQHQCAGESPEVVVLGDVSVVVELNVTKHLMPETFIRIKLQ